METKVVNLRKEPYDIYIGRAGHGHDGYFGNPEPLKCEADRTNNLKRYKRYLWERAKIDEEFHERLIALRGKRLGCFCKPKACHGDIIKDYIEWYFSLEEEAMACEAEMCSESQENMRRLFCEMTGQDCSRPGEYKYSEGFKFEPLEIPEETDDPIILREIAAHAEAQEFFAAEEEEAKKGLTN